MRSRDVVVICSIAATACLKFPTYESRDATGDDVAPDTSVPVTGPQVRFEADGVGGIIIGGFFRIEFGNISSRFHYPTYVSINNISLLASPNTACNNEDQAGIALYPMARISESSEAPIGSNNLVALMSGPAVTQVNVIWSSPVCTMSRLASGYSTFTAFPDGRIVRYDQFDIPGPVVDPLSTCACPSGGSSLYTTSFWTFDSQQFDTLYYTVGTMDMTGPLPGSGVEFYGNRSACIEKPPQAPRIAFAWPSFARVKNVTNSAAAFVLDFETMGHPTSLPTDLAHSATSVMLLETGGDCPSLRQRAADALSPTVRLRVNTTNIDLGERDGIFGGASTAGGPSPVSVGNTFTIGGSPVRFPFAVWVQFAGPVTQFALQRHGAVMSSGYTVQSVDGSNNVQWILWFHEPLLNANDIITVTGS